MEKNILITTQRIDTRDPILHFFLDWVREFAKHYDTVYVVCLQKGEYELPPNVVVLSLGKEKGKTRVGYIFRFYRYVLPLLLKGRISKIFVHMNEVYVLLLSPFLFWRKVCGIRLVWWKTHAKLSLLSKIVYRFTDKIYTASEDSFKIRTRKKEVTGHGINTKYFIPREDSKPQDVVRILAVGRAVPVKHYEDIISAVALLLSRTKNFKLSIIGVRPEDKNEYVALLEEQIRTLNVSEYVSLHPPVPFRDMVKVYQGADVLVNTTYPNTFDKVLLEAMACGIIPVTPTPAYKSILSPYSLFPNDRSIEEISRVLGILCAMPQNERDALGRKMREEVVLHHNVENLVQKISEY